MTPAAQARNPAAPYTRGELVACVQREVRMRKNVYPRWVELGRMTNAGAQREIAKMEAVLRVVEALPDEAAPQAELFATRST